MLSIQKVILLLDNFHFDEFKNHLKVNNAELSFKLVTQVSLWNK